MSSLFWYLLVVQVGHAASLPLTSLGGRFCRSGMPRRGRLQAAGDGFAAGR
jgi:hypothetical protein